jgi:hypothetical protein
LSEFQEVANAANSGGSVRATFWDFLIAEPPWAAR